MKTVYKGKLVGAGIKWCAGRGGGDFLKRSPGLTHRLGSCKELAKPVDRRDSADVICLGF